MSEDAVFAELERLDQHINAAEGEGITGRWHFGQEMLKAEGENGRFPHGFLDRLGERTGKSRAELKHRARFARRVGTEAELANALASFPSWRQIVSDFLPDVEPDTLNAPEPPVGQYRCIVLDPPWPMEKIRRDERPDQPRQLDYKPMTLEEIGALTIPDLAGDGCHVYLWVTHRFLPAGLDLFDQWKVKYECSLTWAKNVGFTPFSWMYDTEHCLFGRIGSLPVERKGLRLSIQAPVTKHSAKPDAFYERVVEASPGPRLEMFARTQRDGFEAWGNEVDLAA